MKRLCSNLNLNNFLQQHVLYNQHITSNIEECITKYPECKYSGKLYRVFLFDRYEFDYIDENVSRDLIEIDNRYNSCSKTLEGINSVINQIMEDNSWIVIIEFNGEGLDIGKLINLSFENNLISTNVYNEINIYMNQEEVLSKVDNNYKIVEIREG